MEYGVENIREVVNEIISEAMYNTGRLYRIDVNIYKDCITIHIKASKRGYIKSRYINKGIEYRSANKIRLNRYELGNCNGVVNIHDELIELSSYVSSRYKRETDNISDIMYEYKCIKMLGADDEYLVNKGVGKFSNNVIKEICKLKSDIQILKIEMERELSGIINKGLEMINNGEIVEVRNRLMEYIMKYIME